MLFFTEEAHQLVSTSAAGVAETTLPAVGVAGTTLPAVGVAGTSLPPVYWRCSDDPPSCWHNRYDPTSFRVLETTLPAAPGIEVVLSLLYNVEDNVANVPLYITPASEKVLVSVRGTDLAE